MLTTTLDLNETYTSKNDGDFLITKYKNAHKVYIKFIATGYEVVTSTDSIKRGTVKDRLLPNVFGVGFIGSGDQLSIEKGIITEAYLVWRNMLQRCYSETFQKKRPTYKGCSVASEWHNFQVFALWFNENYIKGYNIDKDIKINGNKVYSPETCLFVTTAENTVKAHALTWDFIKPNGEQVTIYNLAEYCREHSLNKGNMSAVHKGVRNIHKGYTVNSVAK